MGGLNDHMPALINEGLFAPGGTAPKDENDRIFPLVQLPDDLVGEDLPSHAPVGIGLALPDGQYGVQQQNPFIGPFFQITVIRRRISQIGLKFKKNIF